MGGKILVFHSYLSSPCLDGLVSSLLAVVYGEPVKAILPHRRTPDMNRLFKDVLAHSCKEDSLFYLDIAPVSLEELGVVNLTIDNESITIMDHHELDMGLESLRSMKVNVELDYDLCAAAQVFEKYEEIPRKYEALIDFIQFTEYEGTNDIQQRLEKVRKHCQEKFSLLTQNFKESSVIYAVVDELLSTTNEFSFLIPFKIFKDSQELESFKIESRKYLDNLLGIANGKINSDKIANRLNRMTELNEPPQKFSVIQLPINAGDPENIFCTAIDIRKYGRSLEPVLRSWMHELNCHYAVLINPMKDGIVYVSLRRSCDRYNAKDVARVLGQISGSNKYGGHPWGAGVTMTLLEYRKVLQVLNLHQFLVDN